MNAVLSNGGRMSRIRAGASLLGLLLLAACGKETAEQPSGNAERVSLDFTARIVAEVRPQTKAAPVEGTIFPARPEDYPIGMWICSHEEAPQQKFAPAMSGYGNLLASLSVGAKDQGENEYVWNYTFDERTHSVLSVQREVPIDIYAYHPYTEEAGDPTRIPFTSGEEDWMWAEPQTLAAGDLTGPSVQVPLRFKHAMTCLQVGIRCLYTGSVRLTSMTLTDSRGRLYARGTMNALTGELTCAEEDKTESITISPNTALNTTETVFCIIMPPVEDYKNEEFTLSFVFNGIDGKTDYKLPATMKNLTTQNDVTITEFETGKRYIYHLTLDNTMSFAPVGVDDTWQSENIDLEL